MQIELGLRVYTGRRRRFITRQMTSSEGDTGNYARRHRGTSATIEGRVASRPIHLGFTRSILTE